MKWENILKRINKTATCWLWTGAKTQNGYGYIAYNNSTRRVHRIVYEKLISIIPDNLTLDHLCRNRLCCNPAHLEPVTRSENVKRGEAGKYQTLRTHCPKGHEYTTQNTRLYKGKRFCRKCNYLRNKK